MSSANRLLSDIGHAPKAMQTLMLGGGGNSSAFIVQKAGLAHLEEVILTAIGAGTSTGELVRGGTIRLSRRVFTKVSRFAMVEPAEVRTHHA